MKIKVYTQNVKVTIEDDFALATEYFKKVARLDFEFVFEPITVTNRLLVQNVNVGLSSVEGFNAEIPATDEYISIYAFNADNFSEGTTSKMIGFSKQYTPLISLKTSSADDSIGWIWKSIVHEIMHALCQRAYFTGFRGIIDQMDKTLVGGKWVDYYKNDDPYAKDGNFAVTLKELEPYLATLRVSTPSKYKYFSDAEVKNWGLDKNLWLMLDKARELAGVPFRITSGKRSMLRNGIIGGAYKSTHLEGLGCDISTPDRTTRYKILKALLDVGFKRLGVYNKHIHTDLGLTGYSQNIIWFNEKD